MLPLQVIDISIWRKGGEIFGIDGGVRWEGVRSSRGGWVGLGDARPQAQVCSTDLSSMLFHYNIRIMKWLKVIFFTDYNLTACRPFVLICIVLKSFAKLVLCIIRVFSCNSVQVRTGAIQPCKKLTHHPIFLYLTKLYK